MVLIQKLLSFNLGGKLFFLLQVMPVLFCIVSKGRAAFSPCIFMGKDAVKDKTPAG